MTLTFNRDGEKYYKENQTLFWDEVKFEIPKRPKIKLNEDKYRIDLPLYNSEFMRNDTETAEKALKQIARFAKLLALRDQECPNSRGYEFQEGQNNYFIYKDEEGDYFVRYECYNQKLFKIYFRTYNDAQKIADILNSGRFDLE